MSPSFAHLSRRSFVVGGLALAAPTPIGPAFAATQDLSFLVVGDWGKRGVGELRVASAMAWCAANSHCRFVISVGDNFYDYGVVDADDPQWRVAYEDVFVGKSLDVPWYAVLGNHDYIGNPAAEIEYSARSTRWRMPAYFYKTREALADGSSADFFFIDTNMFVYPREAKDITGIDLRTQIGWLSAALNSSDARWKFVVGHHPVFSGGERHGDTDILVSRLKPLLEQNGVQAYFNGHDHNLQHIQVDGVHYLTSGSGFETRPVASEAGTVFAADSLGFIDAQFNRGGLAIEFIDAAGVSLHSFEITA